MTRYGCKKGVGTFLTSQTLSRKSPCLDQRLLQLASLRPKSLTGRLVKDLCSKINKATSIVLSTHRECDGDGLGAQIALYHALKSLDKKVRILNVDHVPEKYGFLNFHNFLDVFEGPHLPLGQTELALIFDTNDNRQLKALFPELKSKCKEILFIDHHPVLAEGPAPTHGSFIDTRAASTGEIVYELIRLLGVPLTTQIAQALYTSVAFDTQVFRYIRNSPRSHEIAAHLMQFPIQPEEIHQKLFSTHTIEKISFLSFALGQIEYFLEGRIAVLKIHARDLTDHGLSTEETRDVIDMIMNIESLQAAAIFREDADSVYKVSLRSKGGQDVLSTAEKLGGGGHRYAAGAIYKGDFETLKDLTLKSLFASLKKKYGSAKE